MTSDNGILKHPSIKDSSHRASSSRIDTPIRKISYWQMLVSIGYLLALGLLSLVANVTWWVCLLFIVVSLLLMLWMYLRYLSHSALIHITSPQLYKPQDSSQSQQKSQQQKRWQLLFAKPRHHELWEAELVQARDFGKCIQLNFAITHPLPKKQQIILWQDQIEPQSWRRIKTLSRW